MKWLFRVVAGLFSVVLALLVLQWVASESGEVVVVTTDGSEGSVLTTRLWIVDMDGQGWLRSGSPAAAWYQRIIAMPDIELNRGGVSANFTAVPVPSQRDPINDLMRAKYGWADQLIALMFGREDAVPLRLDAR